MFNEARYLPNGQKLSPLLDVFGHLGSMEAWVIDGRDSRNDFGNYF